MALKILGLAASLRNARFGAGSATLVDELKALSSQEDLERFLTEQTGFRFEDFARAGRDEGKPFDELYAELRKAHGDRGLSNSEAALAAALWGALQEGCSVRHVSLSTHFPVHGRGRDLETLREAILEADGLILSSPVYFGDRGSLAQSLIEFIAADAELAAKVPGKLYAGLAVGAKRNGGQETTLIYQMLDMANLDFLAVGNSGETTSQYGGTVVAGDVGKMHEDAYGLKTSLGTGRRIGRVSSVLDSARTSGKSLRGPLKVGMWLLQDTDDGTGRALFENWAEQMQSVRQDVSFELLDATQSEVNRCIACDLCPTHVGPAEEYRCIITTRDDFFVQHHEALLACDAVLLCAYGARDRAHTRSVYQQFIERTRYLRRDHYQFTDKLFAPFVFSDVYARQNLHLRMMTSAIRHHTVVHHPLIGILHEGRVLDPERLLAMGDRFVDRAKELTIGRYVHGREDNLLYSPIGYEISAEQLREDQASGRLQATMDDAQVQQSAEARERLTGT